MESKNNDEVNIKVAVRCRPLNEQEKVGNVSSVVRCNSDLKKVKACYGSSSKRTAKDYSFDNVFGQYSTQREVFDQMVNPIVSEVMEGYNCTVFAYGQTGTGKTFTMEGDLDNEEMAGIIPRSISRIFSTLENVTDFNVRISFLELYNEELSDLLIDESTNSNSSSSSSSSDTEGRLRLCVDSKSGTVTCQNLTEVTVFSEEDVFQVLRKGINLRQVAETKMNKNSSRSHSVFTIKILMKETLPNGEDYVRNGQLNLVDLAGSECIGRSGAQNMRAREAGNINQSLLTLGRVITALVEHHPHIPYRDSKLTRLLQESLGGRAKTCIIATLSPSSLSIDESLSTLDYAHRARSIKNKPEINQKVTRRSVIKEYAVEMEQMKRMLNRTREKNGVFLDPDDYDNMVEQIESQKALLEECEQSLKARIDEMEVEKEKRIEKEEELNKQVEENQKLIDQVDEVKSELYSANNKIKHHEKEEEILSTIIEEQSTTEHSLHDISDEKGEDINSLQSSYDILQTMINLQLIHSQTTSSDIQSTNSQLLHQMTSYEEDITTFEGEMTTNNDQISLKIAHLMDHSSSQLSQLTDALTNLISNQMTKIQEKTSTVATNLSSNFDQLSSSNCDMISSLEGIQTQIISYSGGFQDQINHLSSLNEENKEISLTISSSQQDFHSHLKSSIDEVSNLQSDQYQKINEFGEKVGTILENLHTKHQEEIRNLSKKSQEELDSQTQNIMELVAMKLNEVKDTSAIRWESVINSTCQSENEVTSNLASLQETLEENIQEMKEQTKISLQTMENLSSTQTDNIDKNIENFGENFSSIETNIQKTTSTVDHHIQETKEHNNHLIQSIQTSSDNIEEYKKETNQMLGEEMNHLFSNIQTEYEEKVEGNLDEMKDLFEKNGKEVQEDVKKSFQSCVKPFISSFSSSLNQGQNEISDQLTSIGNSQVEFEDLLRPDEVENWPEGREDPSTRDHEDIREEVGSAVDQRRKVEEIERLKLEKIKQDDNKATQQAIEEEERNRKMEEEEENGGWDFDKVSDQEEEVKEVEKIVTKKSSKKRKTDQLEDNNQDQENQQTNIEDSESSSIDKNLRKRGQRRELRRPSSRRVLREKK